MEEIYFVPRAIYDAVAKERDELKLELERLRNKDKVEISLDGENWVKCDIYSLAYEVAPYVRRSN